MACQGQFSALKEGKRKERSACIQGGGGEVGVVLYGMVPKGFLIRCCLRRDLGGGNGEGRREKNHHDKRERLGSPSEEAPLVPLKSCLEREEVGWGLGGKGGGRRGRGGEWMEGLAVCGRTLDFIPEGMHSH